MTRIAAHPAWIDERALTIAQSIAVEQNITDVQTIARIQIGAIEGIKSSLPGAPTAPIPDSAAIRAKAFEEAATYHDAKAAKWRKEAQRHVRSDGRRSDHGNRDIERMTRHEQDATAIRNLAQTPHPEGVERCEEVACIGNPIDLASQIEAVFSEDINAQASRLELPPTRVESPAHWQNRVRNHVRAMLAASGKEG